MHKFLFSAALLFPLLLQAQGSRLESDQLVIEPQHWSNWNFPAATVEITEEGVQPARVLATSNAIDQNATISAVIANSDAAPNILDGDPSTFWEPNIDSPLSDWWIEIDLGRSVNATSVVLRFVDEELGDPFYQFNVLTSNGSPAFSGAKTLLFNRIGRTEQPNTDQREFTFDIAPLRPADEKFQGEPIRFLVIQVTDTRGNTATQVSAERYEELDEETRGAIEHYRREDSGRERLVDFDQYQALSENAKGSILYYRRELPRLADIEVSTAGDNLSLGILQRGGRLEGFGSLGSEVLSADGNYLTTWDTPSAYANPVDDEERNLFIDLGNMFWLDRIQFIYQVTQASGPFPNFSARISDGNRAPDGTLVWNTVAAKGVGAFNSIGAAAGDLEIREYQAVEFDLTKARFFRLEYLIQVFPGCSGLGCSASMREIQFYGRGLLPEVVLESEFMELGQNPRTLSTIEWDADIPDGAQLQIRTRTGNELEDELHYFDNNGNEVSPEGYRKLASFQKGDSLAISVPGSDWSNWSQFYPVSGATITSPSPRRYIMIQAALLSDQADQAVLLRNLRINLQDPLAAGLGGEISPPQVNETGVETPFTLYLRPTFQSRDPGFDQLLVVAPRGSTPSLLDVHFGSTEQLDDGTARQLTPQIVNTGSDSLWLTLPEVISDTDEQLLALRFSTMLFSASNVFDIIVGLRQGEDIIWQRSDSQNVTDLAAGTSLNVLAPFAEKVIKDVLVSPNPFTPNLDGVNDQQVFAFSIFKISSTKTLFVEVYALDGRRLRRIEDVRSNPVGPQQLQWDGRNDAGQLVPPGLYLCRFGLDVDAESDKGATATQIVSVVY